MLQDHTTAIALMSRYSTGRPGPRRDKVTRPRVKPRRPLVRRPAARRPVAAGSR